MSRGIRSVNEVILIWWIANDPILKETKNWQKLVVFNIWTRRVWTTKEWENKEEVQYHKVAAWWKLADRVEKILKKATKVYIRWYLHNRKVQIDWEEKPRIITEIICNDLLLLDNKRKDWESWEEWDEDIDLQEESQDFDLDDLTLEDR